MSGTAIVILGLGAVAFFLYTRSKEEAIAADPTDQPVSPGVESPTSSVSQSRCPGGCYSNGCKKCVKCGSSKCHNPVRNICYNCSTQKCGRCSSFKGQTVTRPTFVSQKRPGQTVTRPTPATNLARGGTRLPVPKTTWIPQPKQTTTRPRYSVEKPLRTRCIALPHTIKPGHLDWWCESPSRPNGFWQGRDWRCKGKIARYQNKNHICFP